MGDHCGLAAVESPPTLLNQVSACHRRMEGELLEEGPRLL